jgi:hypothetical protein
MPLLRSLLRKLAVEQSHDFSYVPMRAFHKLGTAQWQRQKQALLMMTRMWDPTR